MLTPWISGKLNDNSRRRRPAGARRRTSTFRPRLEALEGRVVPAIVTWDGGAQFSNRWSEPLNWVGDVAPVSGDELEFPAGALRLTNVNNFPSGTFFRSIRFTGSGYTISAGPLNVICLEDGIFSTATSGTNSYNGPIQVDNPSILRVDVDDGGTVQLGGAISGTGGLDKADKGTLTLTGADANTYTGETHVFGGKLLLDKGDASGPRLAIRSRTLGILSSGDGSSAVRLLRDNQIADNATVSATMGSQGEGANLDLNGFSDAIGSLHLTGGFVFLDNPGVLTLNGEVTARGYFGNHLQGASISGSGTLALGTGPRTFTVNEAPDFDFNGTDFAINLAVSASISGGVLVKEGVGRMQIKDCAARVEINAGAVLLRDDPTTTVLSSAILRNDGQFGGTGDVPGSVTTEGGALQTVDNGGSGFTAVGWTSQSTPLGFDSDIAVSPTSPGSAQWTFTDLTPGLYRVFATWPFDAHNASFNSGLSTAAPYRIFDDATLRATVAVDQEKAPSGGPHVGGVVFQQLAGTVNVTSGTLKVQLSNRVSPEQDGAGVVADAVRIERLAGTLRPGFHTPFGFTPEALHLGSATLGRGSTFQVFFKTNDVVNILAADLTVDGLFTSTGSLLEIVADTTFNESHFTAPNPGTAYRIISTGSFTGSFSNVPRSGDPIDLLANGQRHRFTMNYQGGDGNDVDLVYQSTATQVRDLALSPGVINEGDRVSLRGALTDPNTGDVLSLRVDWGDGAVETFTDLGTRRFHFTHTYADNSPPGSPYQVRVEWFDQHGLGNFQKLSVTVNNVPPRLFLGGAEVIRAGEVMHHIARFTDPGHDTWTATIDFGDGTGVQPLAIQPDNRLVFEHRYTRPGRYHVTVTILDDDGGLVTDSFLIIVLPLP